MVIITEDYEKFPLLENPKKIGDIELFPYQLAEARAMKALEDQVYGTSNSEDGAFSYISHFGALIDAPGSGKTLTIIALIMSDLGTRENGIYKHEQILACNADNSCNFNVSKMKKVVDIKSKTTLITSYGFVIDNVWCAELAKSGLKVNIVDERTKPKNFMAGQTTQEEDWAMMQEEVEQYDVILIDESKFSKFFEMYPNLVFKRIVFDEFDSQAKIMVSTSIFTWFVTGTMEVSEKQNTYIMHFQKVLGAIEGGQKIPKGSEEAYRIAYKYIIKADENYITKYTKLTDYEMINISSDFKLTSKSYAYDDVCSDFKEMLADRQYNKFEVISRNSIKYPNIRIKNNLVRKSIIDGDREDIRRSMITENGRDIRIDNMLNLAYDRFISKKLHYNLDLEQIWDTMIDFSQIIGAKLYYFATQLSENIEKNILYKYKKLLNNKNLYDFIYYYYFNTFYIYNENQIIDPNNITIPHIEENEFGERRRRRNADQNNNVIVNQQLLPHFNDNRIDNNIIVENERNTINDAVSNMEEHDIIIENISNNEDNRYKLISESKSLYQHNNLSIIDDEDRKTLYRGCMYCLEKSDKYNITLSGKIFCNNCKQKLFLIESKGVNKGRLYHIGDKLHKYIVSFTTNNEIYYAIPYIKLYNKALKDIPKERISHIKKYIYAYQNLDFDIEKLSPETIFTIKELRMLYKTTQEKNINDSSLLQFLAKNGNNLVDTATEITKTAIKIDNVDIASLPKTEGGSISYNESIKRILAENKGKYICLVELYSDTVSAIPKILEGYGYNIKYVNQNTFDELKYIDPNKEILRYKITQSKILAGINMQFIQVMVLAQNVLDTCSEQRLLQTIARAQRCGRKDTLKIYVI